MKKILSLIVAVLLIATTSFAQIGLGYSESTIRASAKTGETTDSKTYDDGTKVIMIKNEHYAKFYFINQYGKCNLYTVYPLSSSACEAFSGVCDKRYTKTSDGKWRTVMNGKYVYIYMMYDEELEEHIYYFTHEKQDDESSAKVDDGRYRLNL